MKKQLITLGLLTISLSSQCASVDSRLEQQRIRNLQAIENLPADHPWRQMLEKVPGFRQGIMEANFVVRNTPKPGKRWSQRLYDSVKGIGLKFYDYAEEKLPSIIDAILNSPVAKKAKDRAIAEAKMGAKRGFEAVFGSKEEADKDAYQTEWVTQMYANQKNATTEEERAKATKKLRDFFDSEQGKEYALRHLD